MNPAFEQVATVCQELGLDEQSIFIHTQPDNVLTIERVGDAVQITIPTDKPYLVYRGLVLLATTLKNGEPVSIVEEPRYEHLGFMLDASRNAVLSVPACSRLIRYLALMGYSNIQLYMEDTYQLPDEPYFGYFRGAYTPAELQEIEGIAASYGMTFVPCIQTLAHLSAYVKWNIQSVQAVRDVDDILLAGEEKTYQLIDQMFQTLSCLKTRKINIGMDEAYLVGLGRYLQQHGFENRALIMCRHLERVLDIAEQYGFECSMWSDMFFQLLSPSKNYDAELALDAEVASLLERLKRRVTLIYWDYYQQEEQRYAEKIARHLPISNKLAFAGGVWKWIGFTPDNAFSIRIAKEAHAACQQYAIKDVTITGWGDNGGECSAFAILPSLQVWAEWSHRNTDDQAADHFQTVFGLSMADFLQLDAANQPPSNPQTNSGINPNRYVFYQDILCPLLQLHIDAEADSVYYENVAHQLEKLIQSAGVFSYLFAVQAQLCRVLSVKARISLDIRRAYDAKDKERLLTLCQELEQLLLSVDQFRKLYSQQWLTENKVFGLDTLDIRFGGLRARIERASERLGSYISGEVDTLDELEVAILPYNDFFAGQDHIATTANQWHLIATASTISTI